MTAGEPTGGNGAGGDGAPSASKPKRVRTGCLTCRERHLKCDEGLPTCQNCRKSSRVCRRGIRLNFIDTQVQKPPIVLPLADWTVQFQDESRDIASEYKGGLKRYAKLERPPSPRAQALEYPIRTMMIDPQDASAESLPVIRNLDAFANESMKQDRSRNSSLQHSHTNSDTSYSAPTMSTAFTNPESSLAPSPETRDYLNTPEEVLFMQVFVEEVGLWMDSMDPQKHFSRLLPFHALGEPMLLNAFLACGARQLSLVNPDYHEDKALFYYDTATTQLLRSLQNPDRDTAICATAAVALNVYEIMSERALQRMNHIAGARALIKECGWSARSTGIGAACFWLNVGMELLSCLHFNWQIAWDPDTWGVDMNFQRETELGREEIWVHRIMYIVGKIAIFRATIPRFQEQNAHNEQIRLQNRYNEWQKLMDLCNSWNQSVPRTMHPMAYLYPGQTTSKSAFPEVWIIKRIAVVGRLFYHTAMCLMAQINPVIPSEHEEMREMKLSHAKQICGIVAHVKDRGVASVALRSLYIGAECLVERREQEEVLRIFDKIRQEAGWRIGALHQELKEKWGWLKEEAEHQHQQQHMLAQQNSMSGLFGTSQGLPTSMPPAPAPPLPQQRRPPSGILNPLMRTADFSLPNHPYQQYYQPPSHHSHPTQAFY